jgi:hypothetical protein
VVDRKPGRAAGETSVRDELPRRRVLAWRVARVKKRIAMRARSTKPRTYRSRTH